MNKLNLEINNFGPINNVELDLGKINVVGGINGSGKSTASKLLYCFLKAMSSNRKEYLIEYILPDINLILNRMARPVNDESASDYNYSIDDDFDKVLKDYIRAKEIFKNSHSSEDGMDEIIDDIDECLAIILDENNNQYSPVVESLFENESLSGFEGKATIHDNDFKSTVEYNQKEDDYTYFSRGSFEYIPDVFYIDSVSIFDLDYYINTEDSLKRIYKYKEHLSYLLKNLRDNSSVISEDDENKIYQKIREIIGGETYYSTLFRIGDLKEDAYCFKQDDSNHFRVNIASGIQQIGIIQILLHNNKLKPGTFLIIDEPEVKLHPAWQIKFAQILVLLVKELDINLYLNSHSPMFIEAVSLYSQYYDLTDETNVYLTQKHKNNKYDFRKIDPNDMGAIYENLTSPYDELDKLKAKILFRG